METNPAPFWEEQERKDGQVYFAQENKMFTEPVDETLVKFIERRAVEQYKEKNSFETDAKRKEQIEELVHRATRTTPMGGYPIKTIAQWIDTNPEEQCSVWKQKSTGFSNVIHKSLLAQVQKEAKKELLDEIQKFIESGRSRGIQIMKSDEIKNGHFAGKVAGYNDVDVMIDKELRAKTLGETKL